MSKTAVRKPVASRPPAPPEAAPFVKQYEFEPEPGQIGMGPNELEAIGEIGRGVTAGMADALALLMFRMRKRRESMGLSLADVSTRSGLTRQAVSKLETGKTLNPTMDTVFRYAMALDALPTLDFEEIEPAAPEPAQPRGKRSASPA